MYLQDSNKDDKNASEKREDSFSSLKSNSKKSIQPLVEYSFRWSDCRFVTGLNILHSDDDEGRALASLWDAYISTYGTSRDGAVGMRKQREEAFETFARRFISSYSSVIDGNAELPQRDTGDEEGADDNVRNVVVSNISQTPGHPSQVIVQMASMLTDFLDIEPSHDPTTTAPDVDSHLDLHEIRLQESAFITLRVKRVFDENDRRPVDADDMSTSGSLSPLAYVPEAVDLTSPEQEQKRGRSRQTVLHILHSLSTLVHWQHNRLILAARLGPSFAQELVGIIRFFTKKIEEVTESWVSARGLALNSGHWATIDLQNDTSFVVSALLALVKLMACSCQTMHTVSECVDTGFLPPQPWNETALERLGFDMLCFNHAKSPDAKNGFASDSSEAGVDGCSSRDSTKSKSQGKNIGLSEPAFCSAMSPLDVSQEFDSWSAILVNAGADGALVSLLRRVSMFGKVLTASPIGEKKSPEGAPATGGNSASQSATQWEDVVSGPWTASIILQSEILFALLSMGTAHPKEFCNRFMLCDGSQILNMMMLESTSILTSWTSIGRDLVFQRGILCLRLNEVLNQFFSVHSDSEHISHMMGDTNNFTLLITESMGWFLSWVRAAYNYEDEYFSAQSRESVDFGVIGGEGEADVHRMITGPCDDVVVGCVQTPELHAPSYGESDLWPWTTQSQEENRCEPREEARVLGLSNRPTGSNYRLCHPCSEAKSYEKSTKSTDEGYPNALAAWAKYVELCMRDLAARSEVPQPASLPWFLCGKSARAWQVVFSVMLNTCLGKSRIIFDYAKQTFDSKRRHILSNFVSVWGALLSSLDESVSDITKRIKRSQSVLSTARQEIAPMFEMHFLLFVARCMASAPVNTIEACCEEPEIWSSLFSSKFFLGGRKSIEALINANLSRTEADKAKEIPIEEYVSEAGRSMLCPVLRCTHLPYDSEPHDPAIGLVGYTWAYVHDCVLDLTSLITTEANCPPANRIVNLKRSFDVKPVIHALQTSSEHGCDDVTFQLLRWMKWYLIHLSTKAVSVRNAMSSQFFRASLAVCGYHLGDVKASAILQKDYTDDPVIAAQVRRPFMWSARRAACEVVVFVLEMSDCDRWLKLFSTGPVEAEGPIRASREQNLSKPGKSPAHVTLMLLFVDVRLRNALCYIIIRVLMRVMLQAQEEEDETGGDSSSGVEPTQSTFSKGISRMVSGKNVVHRGEQKENHGSKNYENCVRDIYMDLFELVKWSSRQPSWYDGSTAAVTILQNITNFIRSYRQFPNKMKLVQKWMRIGPIISELITSMTVCINYCKPQSWDSETKIKLVRQGLACLTAVMSGDSKNKAEFKSAMMSRRSTRSLASSSTGSGDGSATSGSKPAPKGNNSIIIRYDDFNDMILQAQTEPDLETILVLMETLLDEPLVNSRQLLAGYAKRPQDVVDGFFADQNDRPQICNMNVIPIIFGIITGCDDVVQKCILNSFYHLIIGRASLVNISNCSQMNPSLLDMVLDHFPEQSESVQYVAVKLLQTLGRHSISVAQLKRMFQMMRSSGDYRPAYTSLLLRSLQGMIDDDVAPRHSFVFGGINSGLKIPPIPRWPATTAYTLSLWLRVESPQWNSMLGSADSNLKMQYFSIRNEYRPYILSLRGSNGTGVEVYLKRSHSQRSSKFLICISCYLGGTEVETFQLPSSKCVVEGRWHYLAISHRASGFRTNSEVEIMLDDQFVRHKLSYPRFTDAIDNPLIGDCAENYRDPALNTTMRGQISAVYMFSDALTEGQLRGIHCLGPSYIYAFEPFNTVHRNLPPVSAERKQAVDPVLSILDGSLTQLIILAYNPAVWNGDLCLDNTPEKNQVRWKPTTLLAGGEPQAMFAHQRDSDIESAIASSSAEAVAAFHIAGKMHAKCMPGTYRSTTSDVRIALNSLGGIQVLLPLFTQFDQPRVSHDLSSLESTCPVEKFDHLMCPVLLDLLFTLLVKTSENEIFFREFFGVSLIGYFLERISPKHWTISTLEKVLRIREKVLWNPVAAEEVLDCILLNFKIWVFTDFEVQFRLLQEIEAITIALDPKKLKELNIVNRLVDALYLLYDYDTPDPDCIDIDKNVTPVPSLPHLSSSSGSSRSSFVSTDKFANDKILSSIFLADRWIHSTSGEVEGVKLRGKKLSLIRSRFFRIIVRTIRLGNGDKLVNPEDISTLVRYVVLAVNSRAKVEVLTILVQFLDGSGGSLEKSIPNVLVGLSISRGLLSLMPLVSHKNSKVRMYSLLLLCIALRQAAVYPYISAAILECKKSVVLEGDDESAVRRSESQDTLAGRERIRSLSGDGPLTNQHPSAMKSLVDVVASPSTEDCVSKRDTFSRLGLPTLSLVGVMIWVEDEIVNCITAGMKSSFIVDDDSSASAEAKIAAQALQFTFMGESCAVLGREIAALPNDEEDDAGSNDSNIDILYDGDDIFEGQHAEFNDLMELNSPISSRASLEKIKTCAPLDISPIQNVADKAGRLTESSVCIPMLLPAILSLIRQRHLSVALRLSVMVNLRTFIMQHNDNFDRILRIPAWQDYFFQVIVEESATATEIEMATSEGDEESRSRYVIKSQALTDTCLRCLCDIQFAAVRIGRPVGPPEVVSPAAIHDKMPRRMTVDRIFKETRSGTRQLGVSVLRETMSFLRIYHRIGQIDMYPTAFSLLQQTVNALQRESDMLVSQRRPVAANPDSDESQMKMYFQKILTLNIWLVGAVVLEFLTFPLKQGIAALLPTCDSEPASDRDEYDGFSRLQSSVASSPERGSIRQLSGANLSVPPTPVELSPVGSPVMTPNRSSRKSVLQDSFRETASSLNPYEAAMWNLVISLTQLMGPLGPVEVESFDQYGSSASQVEYLTGQRSAPRIDASVSAIVAKPVNLAAAVPALSSTPGGANSVKKEKETPYNQAVGGVYWIMIRVLCSVFVQGSMVADMADSANSNKSIIALLQLKSLIAFICDQKLDGLGFEINNVIGRLSGVLQSTTLSVNSEWVQGALKVLIDLVSIQRSTLLTLIMAASHQDKTENDEEESRPSVFMTALSAMRTTATMSLFSKEERSSEGSTRTLDQMHSNLPDYVALVGHYINRDPRTYTTAQVTLEAIRVALAVPEDFELDWMLWTSVMIPVMAEADAIENEYRRTKLTEMGMHKHSEEVRAQLDQQRLVESKAFHDVANSSSSALVILRDGKLKSLRENFRASDASDRRTIAKWNQIVSRLANERGPWGGGTADEMEVFWMVDTTETNCRMTPLLRRNEEGTRHQVASFLSRGKKDTELAVAAQSEVSESDASAKVSNVKDSGAVNRPAGSGFISSQGLWRNLMKYQKNSANYDSQAEPVEKLEEDEVDESKEAQTHVDMAKVLFSAQVEIITNATNSSGGSSLGTLEVTKSKITFTKSSEDLFSFVNKTANTEFLWACQCFPSTTWSTSDVCNLLCRSYQLRFVAVEVFFTSRHAVFFNLFEHSTQRQFYDVIRRLRPPYLQPHYGYKPSSIINRAIHFPSGRTMTQAWVHRKITNYEYLMYVNTVAGRSFNDMSQYPVFPWIIANYTSSKLNLTEAKTFRDLRWPMGAQQEHQREIFHQKYKDLEDCYYSALEERKYITDPQMQSDCLPPFHYGSHFSTMGFVLWYLIRQEPFTSLNIWMQDGRFDKPDRIFDTIELCWRGCTSNQADVKELIPEFFYCPEFLENPNRIALGTTSAQKELGPVGLPPWAKNAQDFIRQHRNALESEYVSAHLHNWIDLVFGYKQRPPHMGGSQEAVNACNIYFHLTYAGAVDLDDLRENDVPLYNQMVRQIDNYGQTPTQLFTRPHPERLPLNAVDIFWPLASVVPGIDTIPRGLPLPERPRRVVCFKEQVISTFPIVFIGEITSWDKLITVDTSRIVASHLWQIRPPDVVPPFQFKIDTNALRFSHGISNTSFNISSRLSAYNSSNKERRIGAPFAPHQLLRSDYVYDTSSRRIRLPAGNKALFEKEEAARSNWRVRGHGSSSTTSKKSVVVSVDADDVSVQSRGQESASLDDTPIVLHRVDEHINSHLFALCPDHRLLFSCGHWDYSFKATAIDSGRLLQSVSQHRDVVTCMTLATDFGYTWLVTGSRDCTLIVWEINPSADKPIGQRPLHVLYGHDDAVNCVDICVELDVVVSGSDDGTIIVHKLREGAYIRSISVEPSPTSGTMSFSPSEPIAASKSTTSWRGRASSVDKTQTPNTDFQLGKSPSGGSDVESAASPYRVQRSERSMNRSLLMTKRRVHNVGVCISGFIFAYSNDDSALYTFTINGKPQARKITGERLHAFRLSEDHRVLITGGERGLIVMRWVHSLELSNVGSKWEFESVLNGSNAEEYQKPFNSPIRCIYLTQQERHMMVGLESGELRILAQAS